METIILLGYVGLGFRVGVLGSGLGFRVQGSGLSFKGVAGYIKLCTGCIGRRDSNPIEERQFQKKHVDPNVDSNIYILDHVLMKALHPKP